MPVAPIIAPGSSLAASANVIRTGTFVINWYTPALVQVNELVDNSINPIPPPFDLYANGDTNAATIASANMPTIFIQMMVLPGYYDTTNGPVAPMNAVSFLPIIVNNYFGYGVPVGQPIHLYPGVSSYFSIRAPIEKIGFRVYCSAYQTSPIVIPGPPDTLFGLPNTVFFQSWPQPPDGPADVNPSAEIIQNETFTSVAYQISVSQ